MKYLDIKIVEEKTKTNSDYAKGDLFEVIIKINTQEALFRIPKVPFSTFSKGKESVVNIFTKFIKDNHVEVAKSFKIVTIQVVDPDGVKQPLEDLFPSIDGDKDANKDDFEVVATVNFADSRIFEYKQWLADESQTEFKRDQRTKWFDKDRLKELTIIEEGHMQGALVDPKTGKAVGAIAGTPAAKKLDAYMQTNQNQDTIVGIVEIGVGGGTDSEGKDGKDGKEGEEGEQGEPLAAGEVQDLVDEFYKGMHPTLFGLGDWSRSDWWGTDEHVVLRALKKIRNKKQMQQVWDEYTAKHDEHLSKEIMSEYMLSAKKHKGIDKIHVKQLNREFKRLGLYFRNEDFFQRIEKWGR
jgi:hypothetical protein